MENLDDALKKLKDVQPTIERLLKDSMDARDSLLPDSQKNVVVDGMPCVLQKFKDKVSIILPSKDAVKEYYDNFGIEKPKPKKNFFKWWK